MVWKDKEMAILDKKHSAVCETDIYLRMVIS